MLDVLPSTTHRGRARLKVALLAAVAAVLLGAYASSAQATVGVANHTDPAGDATPIGYVVQTPIAAPVQFALRDGEVREFGPFEGQVTMQIVLPAGWLVSHVECIGQRLGDFVIDVPHGLVTLTHHIADEQFCSFTSRRASPTTPPLSGVAPSPPQGLLSHLEVPARPALLQVTPGRGFVLAAVWLPRRSAITGRLLYRGRVVGRVHARLDAGNRQVGVALTRRFRGRMRARGRTRVTVTLRLAISAARGPRTVFRYRAIVRL